MKFKKTRLIILLALLCGRPAITLAHEQPGNLGISPSATDVWRVSCFNDSSGPTYRLFFTIRSEVASPALVSAQVLNGDQALSATDHINADPVSSHELDVVHQGNNDSYTIVVDKSAAGKASYFMEYHCQTSGDVHTGTTDIIPVQDQ